MIKEAINELVEGNNLSSREATEVITEIMCGQASEAQIGAFLTALRLKGETVEEVSAFATVMRKFCFKIHPKVQGRLVDTCGTGGDKIKTFNVSTTSAFVVAGAGISVAKHGNRSVTSKSGSADVLEKLGLNLNLAPEAVERVIEEVGIGFMFAPKFHPSMKHAIGPRRQIGIRTIFNVLGPLTNPAGAEAQLLGVYSERWLKPLAQVLDRLGCEEAMVVHGTDGLDEISIVGKTDVAWLKNGEVRMTEISPEDFGFRTAKIEEVSGTVPKESAEVIFQLLNSSLKSRDPKRDMVLLNAAAGILVGGKAEDLASGIELASEAIESGSAYSKLKMAIRASKGDMARLEEIAGKYV